jgi:hypothetical protein
LATPGALTPRGWRGDQHQRLLESAQEVGLQATEVELNYFTQGFKAGMTLVDPEDRSIVLRGRTVLRTDELKRSLRPLLLYVGVAQEAVQVRTHDGVFELRIAERAAARSRPALGAATLTLKLWLGFGLLGLASLHWVADWLAAIVWGMGLVLGAWQLRGGITSGRVMLAARLALGLAMLAQEQKLVLPPAGDD